MDTATQIQDRVQAVGISLSINNLGECFASNSFPSSNGSIVGLTERFNFGVATSLGEGKLWIQTPIKFDFVSHPGSFKGLVDTC